MEAAGLLRLLYEREYGVHVRKADTEALQAEASLAARYVATKRTIPFDPDYTPET